MNNKITLFPKRQISLILFLFIQLSITAFAQPYIKDFSFGGSGTIEGKFNQPIGMAFDLSGNILVADNTNNRIQKFTKFGEYISQFGIKGTGNGQLSNPWDVEVDKLGNILVVDAINNRIQKFNSSGQYLSQFGSFGTGDGQFYYPRAIKIDANGNFFVADQMNNRIQKFSPSGIFILAFGATGAGQLSNPQDLALDSSGNVFVLANSTIKKFTNNGVFLSQFGSSGTGQGQFFQLQGIDIDSSGRIYVCDQNYRTQIFSNTGLYLSEIAESGYRLVVNKKTSAIYWSGLGNYDQIVKYSFPPQIEIKHNNSVVLNNDTINFGNLELSTDSIISFEIINIGQEGLLRLNSPMTITFTTNTSGKFTANYSSTNLTIKPDSSTFFQVKFNPTEVGNYFSKIRSINNSDNFDTISINFTGSSLNTGVFENTFENKKLFNFFPNPTNGEIALQMEMNNYLQQGVIDFFDLNGNIVKSFNVSSNSDKVNLSISDLNSGIYYCFLRTKIGISKSEKIVIIK